MFANRLPMTSSQYSRLREMTQLVPNSTLASFTLISTPRSPNVVLKSKSSCKCFFNSPETKDVSKIAYSCQCGTVCALD